VAPLLLVGLGALPGSAPATVGKTEVVRWSPFDAAGNVKKSLTVKILATGECVDTYTTAGDIAYRCGRGHFLYFPCWRDGPNPTEFVLCTGDPWASTVSRLRSPRLLLYPGVTYRDAPYAPWAIELNDGDRCTLFQGAHSAVRRGGHELVVDYYCKRAQIVLLRNLRRGPVWRIGAARFVNLRVGYKLLGDQTIRRAIFGGLPPPMERQRELGSQAVAEARRVVHRQAPRASLDLVWLRLTLPDARWAHVIFSSTGGKGWFAVLHHVAGRWEDASSFRPYCEKLPRHVRRQLFLNRYTWKQPPYLAPPGETRC
jgi:hypothetical protein